MGSTDSTSPPARYLPADWVVPRLTEHNRALFTSGKLLLQRCARCQAVQHPPGEFCFQCRSLELTYTEVPGRGVVISYTIVHHPAHPMLEDVVPYNVVLVELAAAPGVRLVGNVVNVPLERIHVGIEVTAQWAPVGREGGETIYLPQWVASSPAAPDD